MLSLHSILLQSPRPHHNHSTTTPLPHVNMVIFKSYLCHFFWFHLTENLTASILNLIFSSSFYSLVTFIWILVRLLNSRSALSIFVLLPTNYTIYCSCWSSSHSQHQPICSFWNLGHSLYYFLWTVWSNSSGILPHQHPSSCFSNQSKEKNCWRWHCFSDS